MNDGRSAPAVPTKDVWDRWALLWDWFFAATLLVPTVIAVAATTGWRERLVTVAFAGTLGLWHWAMTIRHPEWVERWPMAVWFAGSLLLAWPLFRAHGVFFFLVYGLYPQVFGLLGRWSIPGAVVLTLEVFLATGIGDDGLVGFLVNFGGSVALAVLVGLFITALARQSDERKAALEQLAATRAELARTSHRTGVLEERARLAREIHDTVAQAFTGIVMQLEAAEQALDADTAVTRGHLDRARRSARESLDEVRRSVHALRPELLEGGTLDEAVERIAHRWSLDTGVPATVTFAGDPRPMPPAAEVALVRMTQESLANVARHAAARSAAVELAYDTGGVVLTVTDDGIGMTDDGNGDGGPHGIGLHGMHERITELGGRLSVEASPGSGTCLRARVPLVDAAETL